MKTDCKIFEKAKQGQISKMICGAANLDPVDVEHSASLAVMSGQDIIDVSGVDWAVVEAGVRGRDRALQSNPAAVKTLVMASVAPNRGDVHFQKVKFGNSCGLCRACMDICPNEAIEIFEDSIAYNYKRCRGCGHCAEVCPEANIHLDSIEMSSLEQTIENSLNAGADAIEIHLSGYNAGNIEKTLAPLSRLLVRPVVSICIGSQLSSPKEIAQSAKMISEIRDGLPTFLQCDGSTMAGSEHGISSLAIAEIVIGCNLSNLYIICSGGCSSLTWRIAGLAGIPIAGIGMGISIREKFRRFLKSKEFISDRMAWNEAEKIGLAIRRGEINEQEQTSRPGIHGAALSQIINQ